jgi:hypothetical protein
MSFERSTSQDRSRGFLSVLPACQAGSHGGWTLFIAKSVPSQLWRLRAGRARRGATVATRQGVR